MNAEYTGKKIAELRKEKNMTQKELAAALDSTPSILLGLEEASKEEIVNSFAEISNQQSEEALKDIQQVGWIILFAGIFLGIFLEPSKMPWFINALLGAILGASIFVLRKYKAVKEFELLDVVLAEVMGMAGFVFLLIQLVTGSNPIYIVSAIIIMIVVVCVQVIFYRVMKPQWMKILPVVVSVCWLCWGILLDLSKTVWANRYMGEFIVYYILPAVSCLFTWSGFDSKDLCDGFS